jgi:uncharacterized protein (TIGR02391 family)
MGKSEKYVREQISKQANRLGVSSEAAQIIRAKQLGIASTTAQRRLEPHMQEQVRQALPIVFADSAQKRPSQTRQGKAPTRSRDPTGLAIDYLLSDGELKSRCKDLLKGRHHFDRVLREATTVLETRIKSLAGITSRMDPADLVSKAISPNPDKAILVLSKDKAQQEGLHGICRGIVLAFRNPAHHQLNDKVTQQDALKFCAFVDMLFDLLAKARKQNQR